MASKTSAAQARKTQDSHAYPPKRSPNQPQASTQKSPTNSAPHSPASSTTLPPDITKTSERLAKPRSTPLSALSFQQLNASAVNSLSQQAHPSRPAPRISDGGLPARYKAAARRYTAVMVALPIAIVTSWVLWDRLALGHQQKKIPSVKSE